MGTGMYMLSGNKRHKKEGRLDSDQTKVIQLAKPSMSFQKYVTDLEKKLKRVNQVG